MLEDGHLFALGLWNLKYESTQQPVFPDSLRASVIKERYVQVIFFTIHKCFNSKHEHWRNSLVMFQSEEQNELVLNMRNKSLFLLYTQFNDIAPSTTKIFCSVWKGGLFSAVNMAGLEREVLGTIIPDTTVHIINTGVKPVWLFCLGRNPTHGFQMFYLFL